MILNNERSTDAEDVGVLLHAIFNYAQANEERLDRSLVAVGYATLLGLAQSAAEEVASMHSQEGDDWDGVAWFERLSDTGEGSLAAALFINDDPDVEEIVSKWLAQEFPQS